MFQRMMPFRSGNLLLVDALVIVRSGLFVTRGEAPDFFRKVTASDDG
jgi:hypothetical protein